jgi:hypothetical protein
MGEIDRIEGSMYNYKRNSSLGNKTIQRIPVYKTKVLLNIAKFREYFLPCSSDLSSTTLSANPKNKVHKSVALPND